MSEKARGKPTEGSVPLMDELTELIEKERTLLNLKLLAQKNETATWRQKYDKLIEKVGSGGTDAESSVDQQLEAAAAVESFVHGTLFSSYQDIQRILVERTSSWILDLKDVRMNVADFAKLCKEVFGARSMYVSINTVNLTRCSMTDEFTTALLSFIRSSRLQAIDLSSNELSETFFLQLLSTLKDRRATPEYILLENNVPLSYTAKHFAALLDTLTESTWGLTVTLRDFTDIALSSGPLKVTRAAKKEANYDYKEVVKQPNLALEFLRTFNAKLDPAGSGPTGTSKVAIKKAAASSKTAVLLGRTSGLHRMTVFGLKYAQLSKRTVALLETTLLHTASSLTDLDLSFAYMGFPGAEVMQKVLSAQGCQIIRLALIGNAFGDAGMAAMSKSLQGHATLTYLDLRSNAFSNQGLQSLSAPLAGNHVLCYLDLRGNAFSDEAFLSLQAGLRDEGSHLHINWAQAETQGRTHLQTQSAVVHAVPRMLDAALFEAPQRVKAVGVVGKMTKLFSVDLTAVLHQHVHAHGGPVALQWRWRPVPLGTYCTTGTVLTLPSLQPTSAGAGSGDAVADGTSRSAARARPRKATSAETSDNAAFFQIGSTYAAYWEVRVMHNHQELFRAREPIAPTSAVARGVLQRNPDWVRSSVILNDLHARGTVEVFVVCADTSVTAVTVEPTTRTAKTTAAGGGTGAVAKKFIAFEGAGLSMSAVPVRPFYPFGGDGADLSVDLCNVAGRKYVLPAAVQSLYPEVAGFSILRRLRWTLSPRGTGQLCWQAKLQSDSSTPGGGGGGSAGPGAASKSGAPSEQDLPPNHHSLGYAWMVLVCSAEGGARNAAEGVCSANLTLTDAAAASASEKLVAWMWHDCTAQLAGLHADDTIFLAAKAISEQPNYPAAVLKRCAVTVRGVHCTVHDAVATHGSGGSGGGALAEEEEEDDEAFGEQDKAVKRVGAGLPCDVDFASLLAVHDDASVCVPL